MQAIKVKEIMVPLKDYATVSENATMFDAVLALEAAQAEFDQSRYRHRAVLVYNDQNQIVGKISQLDLLKALEPKYDQILNTTKLSRTGYSLDYIKSLSHTEFWDKPLNDICRKAADLHVKRFMYTPDEEEFIEENAELNEAVHQLIVGRHHSLLVTRGKEIVGVLRLTDVFKLVCERIKACKI
ncbi:CBS domain-containing protein [Desulfatitalea alkaliphila]|uniref:CBS domain-containing protein n=1 Tax=Desulfatitalea alkaliphila TaxID=2929485 RepID=A0AA41UIJ8_9BACT|nr:CBS domain-containing protein [Desulfatitalea alkaliphila]MCJ8500174.1 CBS domain-containing protein [Desulfatitalea alkaliphila]